MNIHHIHTIIIKLNNLKNKTQELMKFSKKTSKRKPGIHWVELDSTLKTDSSRML